MKKNLCLLFYILAMGWFFSFLDWKSVQMTRLEHPEWKEWMHAHERTYAIVTRTANLVLCAPAAALKPIFYDTFMRVEASKEEQDQITHAPRPSWSGFYHLTDRRYSWTFVPWWAWFLYWLPVSVVWVVLFRKVVK